jgi:hypothetical protein
MRERKVRGRNFKRRLTIDILTYDTEEEKELWRSCEHGGVPKITKKKSDNLIEVEEARVTDWRKETEQHPSPWGRAMAIFLFYGMIDLRVVRVLIVLGHLDYPPTPIKSIHHKLIMLRSAL